MLFGNIIFLKFETLFKNFLLYWENDDIYLIVELSVSFKQSILKIYFIWFHISTKRLKDTHFPLKLLISSKVSQSKLKFPL